MNNEELKKILDSKDKDIILIRTLIENEYLTKTLRDKEKEMERLIKLASE